MLDGDRKRVSGALADHYILQKKRPQADSAGQRWADLRKKGIDFRASGNEPFWSVQIDFDKMMIFKVMDGDSLVVPVPEMRQDTASKARIFSAETEPGLLRVKLYPTGCMDSMSGEVFSHGVNVAYRGKTYRGCGSFINDKYELNDFWTVHSLDGEEIAPDSLMKTPALHFNLRKNRVSGNSGCNQLTGRMELQGDSLSFGQLTSTKMACRGSMEFENEFLNALGNVTSYDISRGELKLTGKKDTLMVLRRAE